MKRLAWLAGAPLLLLACGGEPAPVEALELSPPTDAPRAEERLIVRPPEIEMRIPDIEYVPTPENVVEQMLAAAELGSDDVLYDLGCGDGRIVVTAAQRFGIRARGFDIDPQRISEARANVERAGVEHLVSIERADIFELDLSGASVISIYLSPKLNVRLIPQLEKLRPGSRIVSHDFDIEGVEFEEYWTVMAPHHRDAAKIREHYVFLWRTPLAHSSG